MNIIDTIKAISKLDRESWHRIKVEVSLDLQDIHEIADALDALNRERMWNDGAPAESDGTVIVRINGNELLAFRTEVDHPAAMGCVAPRVDTMMDDDGDMWDPDDVECWRPLDQFHRAHRDIIASIRKATGDAGVPDSELHELVTGAYEQATRAEAEAKDHHARYIALVERLHIALGLTNLSPEALVEATAYRQRDSANYATLRDTLAKTLGLDQYTDEAIVEAVKTLVPVPEPFKAGDKVVIARRPADGNPEISAEAWSRCLGQTGTITVVRSNAYRVEFVDTDGKTDWWHFPVACLDSVTEPEWRTDSIDNAEPGRRVEYVLDDGRALHGEATRTTDGAIMFTDAVAGVGLWRVSVNKWRHID